jgi:ketosteroid isomerase-like protein
MKAFYTLAALACAALWPLPASGQPAEPQGADAADQGAAADAAAHDELRELRAGLVDAIVKKDYERQLTYAHDDAVVTWQNGQVVKGREGLLKFLEEGESDVFKGYTQPPTPADLSILYGGDTAISYGTSIAHYAIAGQEFDLTNHWSATLVKEGDQWKLASYHVSANLLDNPLLNAATKALYWAGGIGLVVGIVLGMILMALIRRRGKQAA